MGLRRALFAAVPLGLAGTAAAQTGAPPASSAVPPPAASSAAPAATATATGSVSTPPVAPAPAASSGAAPPIGAPPAPPPGHAPYPYPPPYYYPYYYPWPPPGPSERPPDPRPATMPYESGTVVPPGYHVETRARRGAVLAGSLMFGIPYGIQLLAAVANDLEQDSEWLLVPVLGSWVFASEECDRNRQDSGCSFLLLHSLTQTTGAVLLIYGLASRQKRLVRDDARLHVLPAKVGSGYGFSAVGRF